MIQSTATLKGSRAFAARRRAFTLLEVLLTLAVLVILASFAWPALDRLAETERLGKAADRVRARWASARASAIESGQMIVFRYTPGGNSYRVECLETDEDTPPACLARLPLEQTLPKGIRFAPEQGGTDLLTDPLAASDLDVEMLMAGSGWSAPIVFYPDGTCSDAQLELRDDRQWSVRVTLRGMTGMARASRPQSAAAAESLPPLGDDGSPGAPPLDAPLEGLP